MYLVTGGAGFIGSNIVRHLVAEQQRVRVLDDFSAGKRENLAGLDEVELVEGSLVHLETIRRVLEGVDYVLHQGAVASVPRSVEEPLKTHEANLTGTLNLLVAAKESGVKRVVLAASSSVYGDGAALPKEEALAAEPLSPYAVQKYASEHYGRVFAGVYGLPVVSLRYFNIFGPYQDPASEYAAVIPRFIQAMLAGERPVIFGDGEQSRDFTYIDNAVQANLLACHGEKVGGGEVLNIACGTRYTLNALVEALNGILGTALVPRYAEPRPGDVRHSQAEIDRARALLGYRVKVDFREGLRRTVDWYR